MSSAARIAPDFDSAVLGRVSPIVEFLKALHAPQAQAAHRLGWRHEIRIVPAYVDKARVNVEAATR
jgi:hypothetical protein